MCLSFKALQAIPSSTDYIPLINFSVSLKFLASLSEPHKLKCRRLEAGHIPRLYFFTEILLEHFLGWRQIVPRSENNVSGNHAGRLFARLVQLWRLPAIKADECPG